MPLHGFLLSNMITEMSVMETSEQYIWGSNPLNVAFKPSTVMVCSARALILTAASSRETPTEINILCAQ